MIPLPPYIQITVASVVACATMSTLWLVQRKTRNAGIVDVAWAAVIGVLGLFFAATSGGFAPRRLLAAALIGVWSARLTVYLYVRVVGHPEEGRYAALRLKWGDAASRKLFWFYQLQAAAALVFALPVLAVSWNPSVPLAAWDALGAAVFACGLGGVTLADRQLAQFKRRADSRGRTCRSGLWQYSRHPNYFFEWVLWWTWLPLAVGAPCWWVTPVIPLLLLYFLLFVTGVPPAEKQALASRGEDYRRYQQVTSVFVPWLPKKERI